MNSSGFKQGFSVKTTQVTVEPPGWTKEEKVNLMVNRRTKGSTYAQSREVMRMRTEPPSKKDPKGGRLPHDHSPT